MKTKKKYIVQRKYGDGVWEQSINIGASGEYTKELAMLSAKYQEKFVTVLGLKYRAKEIK